MDRRAFIVAGAGSALAAGPAFAVAPAAGATTPARIATYATSLRDEGGRLGLPSPGTALRLMRVRDRSFDPSSVGVLAPDGRLLGYLPGTHGQILAPLMDAGLHFDATASGVAPGPTPRLELELEFRGTTDQT
jgi:hypothetical protein